MSDAEKYQRIAEEFAKLKQHNAILKKAVRDEQEKSAKLDLELKSSESKLRTVSEEIDSLTFNNARLTKRIVLLQESLEEEKSKSSSSGWFGSGAKQELSRVQQELAVVREELEVKIRENEDLHMRIFEAGQESGTIREDLQERISVLKEQVKKLTCELEDLGHEHKHAVQRLTAENQNLTSRSEELSETLSRTKTLMQQREHTMTQTQQKLTQELDQAKETIAVKIPFNDTERNEANCLNLPAFDHHKQSKKDELIKNSMQLFKKFGDHWKDWCDAEHEKILYWNRQFSQIPEDHRAINRKVGSLLAEYHESFLTIFEAMSEYFACGPSSDPQIVSKNAENFLNAFQRIANLNERVSIAFKSRLDSENQFLALFVQNETAKGYNINLIENWKSFQNQIEKMASYLSILLLGTSKNKKNMIYTIQSIHNCLFELRSLLKERIFLMQQLIQIETSQDTFMSNDIKNINDKRVGSLNGATTVFDKICEYMKEYLELVSKVEQKYTRGTYVNYQDGLYPLETFINRSMNYLMRVNTVSDVKGETFKLAPQQYRSIPYSEQIKHLEQIAQLQSELKNKDIDIIQFKQEFSMQISKLTSQIQQQKNQLDSCLAEIKSYKERLSSKEKQLNDVIAENTLLKARQPTDFENRSGDAYSAVGHHHVGIDDHQNVDTPLVSFDQSHQIPTQTTENQITQNHQQSKPLPDAFNDTSEQMQPNLLMDFLGPNTDEQSIMGTRNDTSTQIVSQDTLISSPFDENLSNRSQISNDIMSNLSSSSSIPSNQNKPWTMLVIDQPTQGQTSLNVPDSTLEREAQLKTFYDQKVAQYQSKLDAVDKKNVELYQQISDLEKRLKESVQQREAVNKEIENYARRIKDGYDELDTTRANYDIQLKTLTEHMVSLNDRIGSYEEELSQLKNSQVKCGKCKAWNRIEWLMSEGKMGQICAHGAHPSSFNYA